MFDLDLAKYSDNCCLITQERAYSYAEVEQLCKGAEVGLPLDKSLIIVDATTCYETIIIYLALLRKGHAFVMDSAVDKGFTKRLIDIYNPDYVWEKRCPDKEYDIYLGRYGLRTLGGSRPRLHKKLSLMLSTSGSTGSPKLVRLSKESLYANSRSITEYLNIAVEDVTITNLPLHYSYGLSVVNTHLDKGASIVVTDTSIMSREFWDSCRDHGVTTLNGVPYHYEIFRRIGLKKMELPSLKVMTQAGGKLNKKFVDEYAQWTQERGIKFFVMYGQTEATARISYLPPKHLKEKSLSIGIAIPGGELYLHDEDHKKIEQTAKEGELVYRGKNVMLGYAESLEDLSKGDVSEGVLYTGDLAYQDEDGYFYITGRLKRFIKIHGNRIGLDEIEHHLRSKSFDVLCTGVDDKLMIATIEKGREKQLKDEVVKAFKLHHSVLRILSVDEYPRSSSGKVHYQELIKVFG